MTEQEQHEQRRSPRRAVRWKAAIKDGDKVIPAKTVNVSEHGVLLETGANFKMRQIIPVMIQASHNSKSLTIYARAQVRHVVIRTVNFHIGLQFTEVQPEAQKFLALFAEGG
ncbi:PilZ domain-containing protein [Endozoicomonas sp. SM1973]|uniref:PilZ domain-containing protein n=1 Tax=Spartinivicinus marinus TaxID=2994442 RepID=A0A853HXE2_9GAMM|nr:PilZ domain-containing protein [Spartinivicinus marinus]MCX4029189.1 PilZ domain-containing protein [Spartinivicinus marinus]NYZ65903.1 PilZ domain-containing protein [Spartinivicinus marinus]